MNQPEQAAPPDQRRTLVPRFVVIALGLAALAYFLTFVQGLQEIIAPVFLGLNMMIVAYPLQRWLAGRMQRHLAAAIALVLVLLTIVAFFGSTGWAVSELLRELPRYNEEFSELWRQILDGLAAFGVSENALADQLRGLNASSVVGYLSPLVANVSSVALALVTVVTAVFFLAMDSTSIDRRLDAIRASHPQVSGALRSFSHGVRRYWVVATIFGLVVALLDVVALAIIGVPLIWAWGVLAFLTNYIPNIGFVIGLVPPALLALLDGGPGPAIAVIAAYSVLNFSIQSIVQPKFTGESVGVTPTVSFLSLLFWYWVLGWLGALLALPATLLLKALLVDADPRARWINALVSSKRPPAPPRGRKARADRKAEQETVAEG